MKVTRCIVELRVGLVGTLSTLAEQWKRPHAAMRKSEDYETKTEPQASCFYVCVVRFLTRGPRFFAWLREIIDIVEHHVYRML